LLNPIEDCRLHGSYSQNQHTAYIEAFYAVKVL
jgi:hypothetical protein